MKTKQKSVSTNNVSIIKDTNQNEFKFEFESIVTPNNYSLIVNKEVLCILHLRDVAMVYKNKKLLEILEKELNLRGYIIKKNENNR